MEQILKRYTAPGMLEWQPEFRAGRASVRVAFTGGHLSAGGSTPANLTTDDPALQALIENSPEFRTGRIRLAASLPLPDAAGSDAFI